MSWFRKDGGPESKVWMAGLEIKSLFSVLLLRFEDGSREAYHSHAFNALSWVLRGKLVEQEWQAISLHTRLHKASFMPIYTSRDNMHKVTSIGRTWVLSFRGPWADTWKEFVNGKVITLTHGRKEVTDTQAVPAELQGNQSPVPLSNGEARGTVRLGRSHL